MKGESSDEKERTSCCHAQNNPDSPKWLFQESFLQFLSTTCVEKLRHLRLRHLPSNTDFLPGLTFRIQESYTLLLNPSEFIQVIAVESSDWIPDYIFFNHNGSQWTKWQLFQKENRYRVSSLQWYVCLILVLKENNDYPLLFLAVIYLLLLILTRYLPNQRKGLCRNKGVSEKCYRHLSRVHCQVQRQEGKGPGVSSTQWTVESLWLPNSIRSSQHRPTSQRLFGMSQISGQNWWVIFEIFLPIPILCSETIIQSNSGVKWQSLTFPTIKRQIHLTSMTRAWKRRRQRLKETTTWENQQQLPIFGLAFCVSSASILISLVMLQLTSHVWWIFSDFCAFFKYTPKTHSKTWYLRNERFWSKILGVWGVSGKELGSRKSVVLLILLFRLSWVLLLWSLISYEINDEVIERKNREREREREIKERVDEVKVESLRLPDISSSSWESKDTLFFLLSND